MTKIEHLPISQLTPLENNPRRISKEQMDNLVKSLQEDTRFLECRPILVNHTTNEDGTHLYQVYAGNQRLQAAKKLKWKSVPCIVDVGLDPAVMKSRIVKDNKTYGEFDYDILNNEYSEYLLDAGFTEQELSGAFGDVEDILSTEEDCDETLEPCKDEDAITKVGDVYELDGHIVICGDSTNPEGIIEHLEKHQPILMVTDPPYGVEYDPNWRVKAGKGQRAALGKVQNDNKVNWSISYSIFNGSIAYIWHAGKHASEVANNIETCEFKIVSQIIWKKQHFALSRGDYHWHHEPCWYAIRQGCNHNWKGDRKQTTVWEIANLNCLGKSKEEDERTAHSTQKPIECMARPIRNHTDEGEYCYDPFLGSGTTLIAAEQLKRKCIGVELSPAYVDIIVNRWINWRKKHGLEHSFKKNGVEIQEL